jgi:hypothetical protein
MYKINHSFLNFPPICIEIWHYILIGKTAVPRITEIPSKLPKYPQKVTEIPPKVTEIPLRFSSEGSHLLTYQILYTLKDRLFLVAEI